MLAKLDGRRREAKLMRETRDALVQHVGGKRSATQKALIDRACWLTLHVAQLDAKGAAGRGFSKHNSSTYLAWSNSLARTPRQLGLEGAKASVPARSLAEHISPPASISMETTLSIFRPVYPDPACWKRILSSV